MALRDIKIGKTIKEIKEGDSLTVTENIELRDILLYLGLTNDHNPLYLQYDYSETTRLKKPVVPAVLLIGIITSNVSKHLPGPGSQIVDLSFELIEPVYHNSTITFLFTVKRVDMRRGQATIFVEAADLENKKVLEAELIVEPPEELVFPAEEPDGSLEG